LLQQHARRIVSPDKSVDGILRICRTHVGGESEVTGELCMRFLNQFIA
jgi:hypothetical protein